jgi:hypothetical protein
MKCAFYRENFRSPAPAVAGRTPELTSRHALELDSHVPSLTARRGGVRFLVHCYRYLISLAVVPQSPFTSFVRRSWIVGMSRHPCAPRNGIGNIKQCQCRNVLEQQSEARISTHPSMEHKNVQRWPTTGQSVGRSGPNNREVRIQSTRAKTPRRPSAGLLLPCLTRCLGAWVWWRWAWAARRQRGLGRALATAG